MKKKRTVLFVDDDPKVLLPLKRTLADEPYEVMFANNAQEALKIIDTNDIAVIVADLHMPNMSGLGLLNTVKDSHPQIVRLIFSGDTFSENVLDAINKGQVFRYISKPYYIGELRATIRQAVDYYNLHSEPAMLIYRIEKIIDGCGPDKVKLEQIKALISDTNKNLYEGCEKSSSKAKLHCNTNQN